MLKRNWLLLIAVVAAPTEAGEVVGQLRITKPLTKRVAVAVYDLRGVVAPPERRESQSSDEFARAAVYLEGTDLGRGEPAIVRLDQRGQRFEPEVVVVPAGSTVSFPNSDPIFHNVFSLSRAKEFDLGYYPQGRTRAVRFDKPGVVQVYCHLHANMTAAVVVAPNAWYAKPDRDGAFLLDDVPAGVYQLVVWHKAAGFFRRRVEVPEIGPVKVTVEIPAPRADEAP
jgi:plastocyanin